MSRRREVLDLATANGERCVPEALNGLDELVVSSRRRHFLEPHRQGPVIAQALLILTVHVQWGVTMLLLQFHETVNVVVVAVSCQEVLNPEPAFFEKGGQIIRRFPTVNHNCFPCLWVVQHIAVTLELEHPNLHY